VETWKNKKSKKSNKSTRVQEPNLRVCLKVSIVDRLDKLLGDFDDFLFASYNTEWREKPCQPSVVIAPDTERTAGLNASPHKLRAKEWVLVYQTPVGDIKSIRNGRHWLTKVLHKCTVFSSFNVRANTTTQRKQRLPWLIVTGSVRRHNSFHQTAKEKEKNTKSKPMFGCTCFLFFLRMLF